MKHAFVILFLLALGTAFLSIAYFLPPNEEVVVIPTSSPSIKTSGTPLTPPATSTSGSPSIKTGSPKATPSTVISPSSAQKPVVTPKPSAPVAVISPTPSPVASPSPSATQEEDTLLLATRPELILEEARIKSGRSDPFVSLIPVPVVQEPSIPPSKMQNIYKTSKTPPRPNYWRHIPSSLRPEPLLKEGLVLTGIIEAQGETPVAILEVGGKESKIVKSGDILNNSINIVSINPGDKTITLGKGTKLETLKMK